MLTGKRRNFLFHHCSQMPQIRLVADQYRHQITARVLSQLGQPRQQVDERLVLCDVIHQQCTHRSVVIPTSDTKTSLKQQGHTVIEMSLRILHHLHQLFTVIIWVKSD